jgi:hypothetical protein
MIHAQDKGLAAETEAENRFAVERSKSVGNGFPLSAASGS